jgi:hypothetical protein
MERLMKLCMATYAGLTFACGPQSKPPVDTPQTLPPADPPADLSREPTTQAAEAGKPEQNPEAKKREPAQQ